MHLLAMPSARQTTIGAAIVLGVALSALGAPPAALAQLTLAYSFEPDLEGFGPNGGGVTVTQDTIGATEGTQSMKVSIVQGATFVGALTGFLTPDVGDPPGLEVIAFDLTITEAFPEEGFVQGGVTFFGSSQPDYPGGRLEGLAAQFFANEVPLGNLAVGTHEIQMVLSQATHPLTFEVQSFNEIFGTFDSGVNDVIPTGFQIYINKSSTAPWTGYIDNIRVGLLPTLDADFNDDTFVDAADLAIWQASFGVDAMGDADGDGDTDGNDFLVWQQTLAAPSGGTSAVPEPASAALAAAVLFGLAGIRRRSAVRRPW